jgi:hypothetical protein
LLTVVSSRIDSSRLRRHHRQHHVELEVALRPGEGDRGVVADDLGRHLAHRLADDRVHLARHDAGARLQVGDVQLAQAGPRPRTHPPDVVGDLVEGHRHHPQLSARLDQRVAGTLGLEVVARLGQWQSGRVAEQVDHARGELGWGVDAGADGRAAQRQLGEAGQ